MARGAGSPPDARTLRGVTETVEAQERITPPRMVNLAFWAVIANVVLSIVNSVMLWGFQGYLREQLLKSNAKAKKPKDYTSVPDGVNRLHHDLHSGLMVGLVQIAIFGFLLVLLAINFRRGKGWARWAVMLVLIIVVQAPFRLLSLGGSGPVLLHVMSALIGITSIAAIVLLVVPESSAYFAKVRGVTAADRPTSIRDLFTPRPRAGAPGQPAPRRSGSSASNRTPSARASVTGKPAAPAKSDTQAKPIPEAKPATQPKPDAVPKQPAPEKRAKARSRARIDVTATPARPTGSAPGAGTAKSRGKSRKGS